MNGFIWSYINYIMKYISMKKTHCKMNILHVLNSFNNKFTSI